MTNRVTDLLLAALARVPFTEQDVRDAIALLHDHPVARGEAEGQIDGAHIAGLSARNWRLFHTVYDNTVKLEQVLDQYLPAEEAQRVWQRVEALQSEMDRAPKSLLWMWHQLFRKPTQVPT